MEKTKKTSHVHHHHHHTETPKFVIIEYDDEPSAEEFIIMQSSKKKKAKGPKDKKKNKIPEDKIVPFFMPPKDLSIDILADMLDRDTWLLKQIAALETMKHDEWGPKAPFCPMVPVPINCDRVAWQRRRVIEVAKRYINTRYLHHHIPEWKGPDGQGVDCSNFTSWVYNYGLGIKFNSDVNKQADSPKAPGRRLGEKEIPLPGDLIFILDKDRKRISHVALYIGDRKHIDARGKGGVQIRETKGWYSSHIALIRRIIE